MDFSDFGPAEQRHVGEEGGGQSRSCGLATLTGGFARVRRSDRTKER